VSVGAAELIECDDALAACTSAADVIVSALAHALETRGRASLAVSGGSTPGPMFDRLADSDLDWGRIDVFQVDERVAPDGDAARNVVGLREHLGVDLLPDRRLHPMPVGLGADAAAPAYAATLRSVLGDPAVLDVVHLGLGDDGHTASLVPGDAALGVRDHDVAATGTFRGHRRVTLTYPALCRARLVVWLVVGADKAGALDSLLTGAARSTPAARTIPAARSIPAEGVQPVRSVVVADELSLGRRATGRAAPR
jgi:6-phosphogluconolactonase